MTSRVSQVRWPILTALVLTALSGNGGFADEPEVSLRGSHPDLFLEVFSVDEAESLRILQVAKVKSPEVPFEILRSGENLSLRLEGGCREGLSFLVATRKRVSFPVHSSPELCSDHDDKQSVQLRLYDKGTLKGALSVPREASEVAAAKLFYDRCGSRDEAGNLGELPVAISSEGTWQTPFPAGCWSLTLQAPFLTPFSWAEVRLGREEAESLHSQHSFGAAVTLRVLDSEAKPYRGARVDLFRKEALKKVAEATFAGRPYRSVHYARSDAQGRVHIDGVPDGPYQMRLKGRGQDYTPTFRGPLELEAGEELALGDLELEQPATLIVDLSMKHMPDLADARFRLQGWLDPGCGWLNGALFGRDLIAGESLEISSLPSGPWKFLLSVKPGDSVPATLLTLEQPLAPGAIEHLGLEPRALVFRGRLVGSSSSSAALLRFKPQFEYDGILAKTETALDGRFTTILERPGTYDVTVAFPPDRLSTVVILDVEILDPDVEIQLELPTGEIRGEIQDPSGLMEGSDQVLVFADSPGEMTGGRIRQRETGTRAEPDRTFVFRNLESGNWNLRAVLVGAGAGELGVKSAKSLSRTVKLERNAKAEGVMPTLMETSRLQGRVVTSSGKPGAGAAGWISFPRVPDGLGTEKLRFEADGEGEFELEIGPGVSRVGNAMIFLPGGPMTALRISRDSPLLLEVPSEGGYLQVLMSRKDAGARQSLALVNSEGAFLDPLADPASRVTVEEGYQWYVSPGSWTLVSVADPAIRMHLEVGMAEAVPSLAQAEVFSMSTAVVNLVQEEEDGSGS